VPWAKSGRRTFLELLKAFESDFEMIGLIEFGGIVEDFDAQQ